MAKEYKAEFHVFVSNIAGSYSFKVRNYAHARQEATKFFKEGSDVQIVTKYLKV